MSTNMGTIDRAIRLVVGLGLLSLTFFGPQTAWGYIGIIPVFTALIGYCPAYKIFGIRTCPLDTRGKVTS